MCGGEVEEEEDMGVCVGGVEWGNFGAGGGWGDDVVC